MNTNESCIAVIDVGSSAIRGCVGYKDEANEFHVLSSETRSVGDEVRRGMVCNVKGAAKIVREVVDALQQSESAPCTISQVLVSVNAASLRSKEARTVNGLQGTEEVTGDILIDMEYDCESQVPEGKEVFYSHLKEYVVDGFRSQSPLGEKPKTLEVAYTLVFGKQEIQQSLAEMFTEIGVDYNLAPGGWATAKLVVPTEERKRGAVVVNCGAETTTVCVVKEDKVCYLVVIPIGGQSITNDLQRIMSFEEAETEKISHGSAIHYSLWKNGTGPSDLSTLMDLPQRDRSINEIIVARAEEIVANVWAQIQASGINLQEATIYLTGGASRLKDLDVLMKNQTNMSVIRVATNPLLAEGSPQESLTPEFSQCVGLLTMDYKGGCELAEKPSQEPEQEVTEDAEPAGTPSTDNSAKQEKVEVVHSEPSLFDEFRDLLPFGKKKRASQPKTASPTNDKAPRQSAVGQTMKKVEQKGMELMDSLFDGDDI